MAALGRAQAAGHGAQPRCLQARLEGARLPQRDADPAQSALCRRLCLRAAGAAHTDRRRACPQGQRVRQAQGRMDRPAARPSSRLHQLAGIRREPEAPDRERAHEEELRAQVGARRSRAAHRPDALRALRTHDAGLLR